MKAKRLNFVGYDNYVVTDQGQVYSLKTNKYLKPRKASNGYMQVGLYSDGKMKNFLLHRLVALAFLPNPLKLQEINHLSEVKADNRVENLEWCTHKDNVNYGNRNEKIASKRRKQVFCVELNKLYKSAIEAAKDFNCTSSNIQHCCSGTTKTADGYHFRYFEEGEI